MKKILSIIIAIAAVTVCAEQPGYKALPSGGEWKPKGKFSVRKGNILLTDVPEGEEKGKQYWMERTMDLIPFRGKEVTFMVRFRCTGVSKPPEPFNGVKFMLTYKPSPNAGPRYPGGNGMFGDSDGWQWAAFSETFPETATEGTLCMGLQNSYGKVEFDLTSLQVGTMFSPADRINLDWKVEYPEKIAKLPQLRGVMSPHTITLEDIKTLGAWNVNLVRGQMSRNWGRVGTELDLDDYDHWLDGKLGNLEQAMGWSKEFGIRFVIDLHALPGGRNASRNMRMFVEKKYGDHFIEVWKRIAERFRGNPQLYAYDLVNEPIQTLPALPDYDYWNLQRRAAEAIRTIDPDTPIMVESNLDNRPATFAYLSPLRMHNIIYKVHMYAPASYTHQRLDGRGDPVTYPGVIDGEEWNKERIRKELQPVREFQLRHQCRIYIGEFSAIIWAPGAENYIRDCIEVFEEYGWDWSYHAFRESPCWNVEYSGTNWNNLKPDPNTPRKQVLLRAFEKNEKRK